MGQWFEFHMAKFDVEVFPRAYCPDDNLLKVIVHFIDNAIVSTPENCVEGTEILQFTL